MCEEGHIVTTVCKPVAQGDTREHITKGSYCHDVHSQGCLVSIDGYSIEAKRSGDECISAYSDVFNLRRPFLTLENT